jgi:hypothetical protein
MLRAVMLDVVMLSVVVVGVVAPLQDLIIYILFYINVSFLFKKKFCSKNVNCWTD